MGITQEIADFVARTRYRDLPAEVIRLAEGFILDGLGVALAGSTEKGARIIQAYVREMGGREEASILGHGWKAPAPMAALVNGVAGHAMDYDDTQLSTSREAVYGLLTHPTTPVLAAALALAEREKAGGRDLLLAYVLGVEVECRIADAINPRHYQSGFHSTATIGGLGAAAACARILGLGPEALARTLGIAASMAGGLRENFGTMTKPLHAGRAAENGAMAALLARAGHTAAPNILEAPRGFYNAMAGGYDAAKISGRLGRPYFLVEPGISIKPYPSGSLSHPAQDLILDLVKKHDLRPEDIASIEVGTNSNVPNALIYPMPKTALEGKFSIPFCMAIGVLERKAGIAQFRDAKVRNPKVVDLMRRVKLYVDEELEALGYDQVRSRVRVHLKDGTVIEGRYDVARGHPEKPMTWEELCEKFRDCARLVLPKPRIDEAIDAVTRLKSGGPIDPLLRAVAGGRERPRARPAQRRAQAWRPVRSR
ncbi:MAG TPA: MmgE/PrpD family protein [candidate division Zixibacteria bacterium]|nr:MmgE/PrpD family protein [candidate division Zixibacteria bacterium]